MPSTCWRGFERTRFLRYRPIAHSKYSRRFCLRTTQHGPNAVIRIVITTENHLMNVDAWRRQKRAELYAARRSMTFGQRREAAQLIATRLDDHCASLRPRCLGFYWPIRHELNLLSWALARAQSLQFCLPVVVAKNRPLEYWMWQPGEVMQSGIWGIPIPTRRHVVEPDMMIAPLVGFDLALYRLGNGGGYFDRTLAARETHPTVVGVGYAAGELPTIYPMAHDVPMDLIVTEKS